jgi:CRP/FNR family cyclic AMP-dependent transcriptional regulator
MRNTLYILSDLSDRDLLWLHSAGALRDLAPGERLIEAGREVRDLYFVLGGELSVLLPDGRQVARLGLGDVVGEMSFVEKRLPSASVRAESAVRLLAIPRDKIIGRFEEDAGFAARFYRALAVFLSDRLRTASGGAALDEADGELDEGVLDSIHVAGDRFLRLVRLLSGEAH